MKTFVRTTLIVGLTALVAAGCGRQSTSPNGSTNLGSSSVTDATLSAAAATYTTDAVAGLNPQCAPPGLLRPLPNEVPTGCTYDAASGRFVCDGDALDDGPTVVRSYAFLDAGGAAQAAYDAATTASINFQAQVTGERTDRRGGVHSVNEQRNLTASGLGGAETAWTWNGSGSGQRHDDGPPDRGQGGGRGGPGPGHGHGRGGPPSDSLGAPGDSISVDSSSSMTVTNVVIPMPRTATGWPLSGTIAQTITATITGGTHDGETRTLDASVTFNGTQFVPLTVNGTTTTIDLSKGRRPPLRGI